MLLKEGRGLLSHVRLILKCNIQLKHKLIISNDVTALRVKGSIWLSFYGDGRAETLSYSSSHREVQTYFLIVVNITAMV